MTGLLPIRRKTQNSQSINMIIVCTLSISPKQCFFYEYVVQETNCQTIAIFRNA